MAAKIVSFFRRLFRIQHHAEPMTRDEWLWWPYHPDGSDDQP